MASANATTARSTLTPEEIRNGLRDAIDPARILIREIDRVAFASDASFYRLIPRAVVQPVSTEEVRELFRFSRQHSVPLVFRAGGTSLSGQSITDGILVDLGRHMRSLRVEDGGRAIRLQPGVIGQHANDALRLYQRKIGPDPASIQSCRIGGILSNNASGMCCGVAQNAYHTLRAITFVLPSGATVDTAAHDVDEQFQRLEPALHRGLIDLRERILAAPALAQKIRQKYKTKNTTGYSLNAFLDFERPVDIFSHLLIGAEGTLAWIAEAVLNTILDKPVKYTGLLLFATLRDACSAILPLRAAGAAALELMDRAAIRSVEMQAGMPEQLRTLPPEAAGLLVEFQYSSEDEFSAQHTTAEDSVQRLSLLAPAVLTRHPVIQAQLWKMRKGMFPSVGAVRARGTTAIIEDVAFPVDRLADAALDLRALLDRHGYRDAILFGHAGDGNLHFVLTQGFNTAEQTARYERFMDDLVALVVTRYDGALKAEHGTGRNMAPFVETEWGPDAMAILRELKSLVDPDHLLNPGVILNSDPLAHVKHLKDFPVVESEVDKCIECGYCEPHCPSRDFTLTPRQRIAVRREMQRLVDRRDSSARLASLNRDFPYMALDTCAVDGLCASECPVKIDTGQLTKRLREERHSAISQWITLRIAHHMRFAESATRFALRIGHFVDEVIGTKQLTRLTQIISRVSQRLLGEPFWQWSAPMPLPAEPMPDEPQFGPYDAVWFPSCITRVMGQLPGEAELSGADDDEPEDDSLTAVALRLAARARFNLFVPPDASGYCCGVPFSSKGFSAAHRDALDHIVYRLFLWSDSGRIPVVVDNSPCTYGLRTARAQLPPDTQALWDQLTILDSVEFAQQFLLPRLMLRPLAGNVALHPVCSAVKMHTDAHLTTIARACCDDVFVPAHSGCCAFAGDRGFLIPELTASATHEMANAVRTSQPVACYSSSKTCEIAMTRATGRIYRSFLHLLDAASR